MSEFTFATIVKDKTTDDIKKFLKKEKIDGYIFCANKLWVAILFKNDMIEGKKYANLLSKKLGASVFHFINCEDHGWGYQLIVNGIIQADLYIDYENFDRINRKDLLEKANIQLLRDLGAADDDLMKLEQYFTYPSEFSMFDGVQFFKSAFGFEKINLLSYDIFASINIDKLTELEVTCVKCNEKKFSLRKVILETMESELKVLGFNYIKNNRMAGDYAFLKNEDGFNVGLQIYVNSGFISAALNTHLGENELFTRTECVQKQFISEGKASMLVNISNDSGVLKYFETYKENDEESLKLIFKKILHQFINKGIPIIDLERLEGFNAHELYAIYIDNILNKHSFTKAFVDENLIVGGKVVYKRGNNEIIFRNGPFFTYLGCETMQDGISSYVEIEKGKIFYPFKNADDYINLLKNFLDRLVMLFTESK